MFLKTLFVAHTGGTIPRVCERTAKVRVKIENGELKIKDFLLEAQMC